MDVINSQCEKIREGFFHLYLGMEFITLEREITESFGPKMVKRVHLAMRKPVMLSPVGESVLEIYEERISFIFSRVPGPLMFC